MVRQDLTERSLLVLNRMVEAKRRSRTPRNRLDLLLVHPRSTCAGNSIETRSLTQSSFQLTRRSEHLRYLGGLMHRQPDQSRLVRQRTRNALANPPGSVSTELVAQLILVFVHGAHQARIPLLNQIEKTETTTAVLLGHGNDQPEVALRKLATHRVPSFESRVNYPEPAPKCIGRFE